MRIGFIARILAITSLAMLWVHASQAQVIEPQLQQAIQSAPAGQLIPVIITLAAKADLRMLQPMSRAQRRSQVVTALRKHAAQAQRPILDALQAMGASHVRSLWISNAITAQVPASALPSLAGMPGVESIRRDAVLNLPVTKFGTTTVPEWNIRAIRAPELWALGFRGQGVIVASMDTGVDAGHPDLAAKWRGGTNSWLDPNGEHAAPFDAIGHGTQVMGILVGGNAGGTDIGVAPDAKWISVKIFNDAGQAPYSSVHQGFQWLLDPDGNPLTDDAPDVVNNSWGFADTPGQCFTEFQTDIQALKTAGIAVVVAAGNTGPSPSTSVSTANYPESMAVGAVDATSTVASFSGRGPSACDGTVYPEVSAPGVNILTADLSFGGLPFYATVSGTSAAAPHLSGAMALLLSALKTTTVSQLEAVLEQSALDIGAVGADNSTGYGLVDVMEAYNRLHGASPTDADGDGFIAGVDCNDNNPSIHPGAIEIKRDGVDQDCNGYDLTIDVVRAEYRSRQNSLYVTARSALGKDAQLALAGYGPMKWSRSDRIWVIMVSPAGGNPRTVTVTGREGAESRATSVFGRTVIIGHAK